MSKKLYVEAWGMRRIDNLDPDSMLEVDPTYLRRVGPFPNSSLAWAVRNLVADVTASSRVAVYVRELDDE